MSDTDTLWDNLIDHGIATREELQLVTNINGFSVDTLESVIYARTGYRSWEQYAGEDEDSEQEEQS